MPYNMVDRARYMQAHKLANMPKCKLQATVQLQGFYQQSCRVPLMQWQCWQWRLARLGKLTCKTPDEVQLLRCDEVSVGEGGMQLVPEGV